MDKMIVYVDDVAYAREHLGPMVESRGGPNAPAACWIVVACAPRMTHRISKWVSHSARENWRAKWADRFFGDILPFLTAKGDTALPVLAKGPLAPLTEQLMGEHPGARVLDMRRPKFGHDLAPVTHAEPQRDPVSRWAVPGAVAGMGAMLVLAAE
jgi:hypothetical protein